MLLPMTSK